MDATFSLTNSNTAASNNHSSYATATMSAVDALNRTELSLIPREAITAHNKLSEIAAAPAQQRFRRPQCSVEGSGQVETTRTQESKDASSSSTAVHGTETTETAAASSI